MRIWIVLVAKGIAFLTALQLAYGQSSESSLEKTKRVLELVDEYQSNSQLDSLLKSHRSPLVLIDQFIFVPHQGCYYPRHSKGTYEERNAGGDNEQRGRGGLINSKQKAGGVFAQRKSEGGLSERETGGEITSRETGGDDSYRQQAGGKVKRTEGGETADRSQKGDDSQRSAAGKNKTRTEGGETTDRNTKGNNTNRFTEGANRKRRWSGAFKLRKPQEVDENVYCQKETSQPAFLLSNVPTGMKVEVYDFMGRRKVEQFMVVYY
ncbi:hypothetical protein ACFPMF_27850 [Larkinella bovis]|uniref:Uncharacterized protein n=1 Tax=Larkinella bovis TaxID=683041 RepID=A0ABW0IPU7_9BACT